MSISTDGRMSGIAESYDEFPVSLVITDPRLDDNPIVYVNRAFTELTGYAASVACGRNCRFLQGPDTDERPVRELADAVANGSPAAVEIVNYTSAGDKFINHLVVTPIRDGEEVIFFMGIQAGWRERGDALPSADQLTRHLAQLETTVRGQVGLLLSIMREEVSEPEDPREVITLLSTRIDCLAQLYAGVFRRHSRNEDGRVRLGAYLGRVCSGTHTADRSYNVRLSTNFVECTTDVETAAMIGLALSELLANAFGDANPYDDEAEIEVDLEWADMDGTGGGAVLTVKASSRGNEGSLLPEAGSVGQRLLANLLPRLGADIREDNRDGVREAILPLPMIDRPSDTAPSRPANAAPES